jgi:predicted alpha-1,6-mannanase (GH76 family)
MHSQFCFLHLALSVPVCLTNKAVEVYSAHFTGSFSRSYEWHAEIHALTITMDLQLRQEVKTNTSALLFTVVTHIVRKLCNLLYASKKYYNRAQNSKAQLKHLLSCRMAYCKTVMSINQDSTQKILVWYMVLEWRLQEMFIQANFFF